MIYYSLFFILLCYSLTAMEYLVPEVIAHYPHDTKSFTQGLTFNQEGRLFESVGLYGGSALVEIDPKTGSVLKRKRLANQFFAEGLTAEDKRLIQLTWREGKAFIWNAKDFTLLGQFNYSNEGWGLCYDGKNFYMSHGSAQLTLRDVNDFSIKETLTVRYRGRPVRLLNALECVEDHIYANVWKTPLILRINKQTGEVEGVIDLRDLFKYDLMQSLDAESVANGITFQSSTKTFWLTGKRWPILFNVKWIVKETPIPPTIEKYIL